MTVQPGKYRLGPTRNLVFWAPELDDLGHFEPKIEDKLFLPLKQRVWCVLSHKKGVWSGFVRRMLFSALRSIPKYFLYTNCLLNVKTSSDKFV